MVAALRPVAERKGLVLSLDAPGDDLLLGDALRLRQVVMNLLGNALKFTVSGRVSVSVRTDRAPDGAEARLRLAVQDTGAGMEDDDLDRLFRPFVQGGSGARHGGTGLGLALTQQIVQLMGGRIDVVSAPGRGSLFTVLVDLPLADGAVDGSPADAEPSPQPVVRAAAAAASGLRVLVADDNEVDLRVAEALLRAEGAEVVTVPDGDDAVRVLGDSAFDLVLLDMQMPRMSGPAAARAIRALPGPASRTPLLALTAASAEEDRATCLAARHGGRPAQAGAPGRPPGRPRRAAALAVPGVRAARPAVRRRR